MSANAFKLESLTPNIMVENVNATIKFYEEFLGFKKVMSVPEEGDFAWAMIARDGVSLMLQQRASIVSEYPKFAEQPVGGTLIFYIAVKGIDGVYTSLLKLPITIYIELHQTFYGRKEFTIMDCNGYLLTFAEDVNVAVNDLNADVHNNVNS